MRQIRLWFIFLLFALPYLGKGQHQWFDQQNLINPYSLSPAFAGGNGNIEVFSAFQRNWIGIDGAPSANSFSMNGAIANNMGLGGSISTDAIGIFKTISSQLSYAYHIQLEGKRLVYFGLSAAATSSHIDLSGSNTGSTSDPVLLANMNKTSTQYDATAAIGYRVNGFSGGIVLPALAIFGNNETSSSTQAYVPQRIIMAHASARLLINQELDFTPLGVIQFIPGKSSIYYAIAGTLTMKKDYWISLSYYTAANFGITAGAIVSNALAVGYTYSIGSGFGTNSAGSHQLTLGLVIDPGHKTNNYSVFGTDHGTNHKTPYFKWLGN